MKKPFLLFGALILCILCVAGCLQSSQTTSNTQPSVTAINRYKINEPVSDGNLKVTVIKTWDGNRISGSKKEFTVQLKIQNLQSDKKIQVRGEDLTLFDLSNHGYTTTYLGPMGNFDLGPNQSGSPEFVFIIPQNAQGLIFKFDFSGPSGKGSGGEVAYFDLGS